MMGAGMLVVLGISKQLGKLGAEVINSTINIVLEVLLDMSLKVFDPSVVDFNLQ